MSQTIRHELSNGDEGEAVLLSELFQLGTPHHLSIVIEDFTDDTGRIEVGQPSEIDARFGLTDSLQHPTWPATQRKDMAGPPQIFGRRCGINSNVDGLPTVPGGDPRRNAEPFRPVYAYGECRSVGLCILVGHLLQTQRTASFGREGETNEPPAVLGHEIDGVGGHALGCTDQVALVFSILVVRHDDQTALTNIFYSFFDCSKWHKNLFESADVLLAIG